MERQRLFFFPFCFFLFFLLAVQGSSHHHHHNHRHLYGFRPTKLFVFGDSYADTGNNRKTVASSWKLPYGITFPGEPAGRFSDGRVLTDYLAKCVGVKSPVAYRWRNFAGKHLRYGMNFAYGGTGVFDTFGLDPNMTTQIDFLEQLIKDSVYSKWDLNSSVALVTLSGNDYGAYYATGGTAQGLQSFITRVVNQLALNLKRIHGLGVRKVAVTALEPLGCLPRSTVVSSFQQCNGTQNMAVSFHNLLLQQAVAKLNNESKDSTFVILDLYSSFLSVFKNKGDQPGSLKFETPLKPCCMGISNEYYCGSVDEKGVKMYTVCDHPESAFFWDTVHPTQAGWHAVYSTLQATLEQIC
uniref:GDSL esterase/lipase n=1 Tax=Davidia involucrata TaxID=16924 RepID=A0A5B7AYI1_DAVIN